MSAMSLISGIPVRLLHKPSTGDSADSQAIPAQTGDATRLSHPAGSRRVTFGTLPVPGIRAVANFTSPFNCACLGGCDGGTLGQPGARVRVTKVTGFSWTR